MNFHIFFKKMRVAFAKKTVKMLKVGFLWAMKVATSSTPIGQVSRTKKLLFFVIKSKLQNKFVGVFFINLDFYSSGTSNSPSLILSIKSCGCSPSTVHPIEWAVPNNSLQTPAKSLAIDLSRMVLAALIISSQVIFPSCLMFLTFFRSLGGSLSALIIRDEAEGTTETWACRFWMVSLTVTFRPFQSLVFLQMSSPIFFGERPSGPTLGSRG